ncbi:MAG: LD-carboxypeptidase [Bacteroidetes bacterium]|nr:LD-carboxypeptidase [Bacteroidota bacterium]
MTQPPYLQPGDTIALVCPAGFMMADKVQTCVKVLNDWGYRVVIGSTVGGNSNNYFSGTDQERLTDLQRMLDDRSVRAILCARGGYGTGRLIDRLDFSAFVEHPKWIIGFSDITILHAHIHRYYSICTLHAPMAAAFNDGGWQHEYVQSLREALQGISSACSGPEHPFNRLGKARGTLVGGNLALLAHLVGTPSDLDTRGKILFIEDVGEQLYNIDRMMCQLKRSGKLNELAALVVGGFSDCKDTDRPFGKTAFEIIQSWVSEFSYPVCFDFPVSHTERNMTLKHGATYEVKIDATGSLLAEW